MFELETPTLTNTHQLPKLTSKDRMFGLTVHRLRQFRSQFLDTPFKIDIYLPPDYDASGSDQFPLVLFNDGQDLRAIRLAKTLHRLFLEEKTPTFIAVGIHAGERMQEYGVAGHPDYKNRGSKAGRYAKFVTTELLPYIQKNYQVETKPELVSFGGFSLGGLSALDIVWNHPHLFGSVGVFSGALWWRHSASTDDDPDAHRIIHENIAADEMRHGLRFWFQNGTRDETDDRNNNGVIDAIDDTLDLMKILKKKGQPLADIHYREVEGGIHHPRTWAEVMPEFLTWLF